MASREKANGSVSRGCGRVLENRATQEAVPGLAGIIPASEMACKQTRGVDERGPQTSIPAHIWGIDKWGNYVTILLHKRARTIVYPLSAVSVVPIVLSTWLIVGVMGDLPLVKCTDDLVKLIARLYYIDELGQSEVAEIAGTSRSQVSRLLSRARETGVVRISVEEYDARDRELEQQLARCFPLKHALVIRTAQASAAESERRAVGYLAASFVSELVRPGMILGVAGGRTVYELVRHMTPTNGMEGITVVQLMGNIGPSVSNTDAIEISRTLARSFGGMFYTVNAPAFAVDARSRDVFLAHQDVRSVWQLFSAMHLALVGVGTIRDSLFTARGALSLRDSEQLEAQGAVGEICGHFFDRNGRECATDFRDRVVSIGLDELSQREDVIGVTHGAGRAEAIHAALKGGLITSLITDEAGARAVLARVE